MENRIETEMKCPRCGKTYKGRPAISRKDNHTAICPECGQREALEAMGLDNDEIEKIVGITKANSPNQE